MHGSTAKHNNRKAEKPTTKLDTYIKKQKPNKNKEATKAELKLSAFVQKKAFNDNNTAKAVWEQQKHL